MHEYQKTYFQGDIGLNLLRSQDLYSINLSTSSTSLQIPLHPAIWEKQKAYSELFVASGASQRYEM